MTDLTQTGVAYAEANHGRWIARCPTPWCTDAWQITPGQQTFVCAAADGCHRQADVRWPADPTAIEALLTMRPANATRNWVPGEALSDLLAENIRHGIALPDSPQIDGAPVLLLQELDGVAVGGLLVEALPGLASRPASEIGA